jgi:hypothetical protein
MHVHTVVSVALTPVHTDAVVCVAELHVMQFRQEVAPTGAYVVPEQGEQVLRPSVAANVPARHAVQVFADPKTGLPVVMAKLADEALPAKQAPPQALFA